MEQKTKEIIGIKKLLLAVFGILFVGTGVALNAAAGLGNDPVAIVYDGIRNVAHLDASQLGAASNIVNIVLVVLVFFLNRHYVNIGTIIYILPYGMVVDVSGRLIRLLLGGGADTLPKQIVCAVLGCTMLFWGVGMYIATDIGLDPFTGIVMVLKDKVNREYRIVKIGFDIGCIVIGTILGGKLGAITIITALVAGPCIQFFSEKIKKIFALN